VPMEHIMALGGCRTDTHQYFAVGLKGCAHSA